MIQTWFLLLGAMTAMATMALCLGLLLVYISLFIVTFKTMIYAIGIAPHLLFILMVLLIPESPKWLMRKSDERLVVQSVKKLRGPNYNHKLEVADLRHCIEADQSKSGRTIAETLSYITSREVYLPLLIMCGAFVLQVYVTE